MSPSPGFLFQASIRHFVLLPDAAGHSVRYLLRYRELRVGNYLPTAIQFLEDMKAAVRLRDFFTILHALRSSPVRHHNHVGAEHLELVFVRLVRSILHSGGRSFIVGNHLLLVLRLAVGTDRQ